MRKKSKYKPRPVLLDPITHTIMGISTLNSNKSAALRIGISLHGAMAALTRGTAAVGDIKTLLNAANMVEVLLGLGHGKGHDDVLLNAQDAMRSLAQRYTTLRRFVLTAAELSALNLMIELHDALFDVVTVREAEHALEIVDRKMNNKQFEVLSLDSKEKE